MCNRNIQQTSQSHIPRQGRVLPLGPSQTSWNPLPQPSKALIFPLFNIPFLCTSVCLCWVLPEPWWLAGNALVPLLSQEISFIFLWEVSQFSCFPGPSTVVVTTIGAGYGTGFKMIFQHLTGQILAWEKSLDVEITHDLGKIWFSVYKWFFFWNTIVAKMNKTD